MAETGGDGLPFLGSLMTLISHGDIRYEGMLYTIDMPNSTITLSNVRCFGTEGRRKDGGQDVPPSDQVFEYVVFKGSEIKELTVLQPPAPQPAGGFQDPAIVSAAGPHAAPPPAAAPPPPAGAPPGYAPVPPAGGASPWGPPPPYGAQPYGASPWGAPPPGAGAPPPPRPPGQPAPAPAPTVAVVPREQAGGAAQQQPQQHLANGGPAKAPGAPHQAPRIVPTSYAHAAGGGRGGAGGRGGRGPRGGGAGGGGQQVRRQAGGGGGGGAQGGAHTGVPRPPPVPPVEVPKEEFNFEEALKKFNKEEVLKEATEEKPELAGAAEKKMAYAQDDFFDTLSCEALERLHLVESGEPRPDHRSKMAAMRKQDLETFGGMARGRPVGRGYRGRGRGYGQGRGRGGRGSSGGGRGGHGGGNNPRPAQQHAAEA